MELTGERRIPASRQRVWDALNDPAVVKAAIPGCQSLEKTSANQYNVTVGVKVGPISTAFTGRVTVSDVNPPVSYRIAGQGEGGVAGFAKGSADVRLIEDGTFTIVNYAIKAEVGGKLAQLGSRLVDASAQQIAGQFFDRLTAEAAHPDSPVTDGLAGVATAASNLHAGPRAPALVNALAAIPPAPFGWPIVAWIGTVIFLFIFIMLFSAYL